MHKKPIKFVEIFIFLTFYLKTRKKNLFRQRANSVFTLIYGGDEHEILPSSSTTAESWQTRFRSEILEKVKYLRSFNDDNVARLSGFKESIETSAENEREKKTFGVAMSKVVKSISTYSFVRLSPGSRDFN